MCLLHMSVFSKYVFLYGERIWSRFIDEPNEKYGYMIEL